MSSADPDDAAPTEAQQAPDRTGGAAAEDRADVLLDVSQLEVEEITLQVRDVQARVSLQADVLDLVRLHVGAEASLGEVDLTIKGVEAKALLKVRLDNVARILDRVLATIDHNPQIVEQLVEHIGQTTEELGQGAGEAAGELGKGAGEAVEDVGQGAGSATREVGQGAGQAVGDVGEGAGQATREVGQEAGQAVGNVGEGAGQATREVGQSAGQTAGNVGGGAGSDDTQSRRRERAQRGNKRAHRTRLPTRSPEG